MTYMKTRARERATHSSRDSISWSKLPSSHSACVTASGTATTFGKQTMSTKRRLNSGDGLASRRRRSATKVYSYAAVKPISASIHPSDLSSATDMPRPREATEMAGTRMKFMTALKPRMSSSLTICAYAATPPTAYCSSSCAIALNDVRKRSPAPAVIVPAALRLSLTASREHCCVHAKPKIEREGEEKGRRSSGCMSQRDLRCEARARARHLPAAGSASRHRIPTELC